MIQVTRISQELKLRTQSSGKVEKRSERFTSLIEGDRGEQPDRRIHSAAGALRGDVPFSKAEGGKS